MTDVTDKTFRKTVKGQSSFLLVFHADFSGPCRLFKDTIEAFGEAKDGLPVYRANLSDCVELARLFEVKVVPWVCLFKDGDHVRSAKGLMSEDRLREFVHHD